MNSTNVGVAVLAYFLGMVTTFFILDHQAFRHYQNEEKIKLLEIENSLLRQKLEFHEAQLSELHQSREKLSAHESQHLSSTTPTPTFSARSTTKVLECKCPASKPQSQLSPSSISGVAEKPGLDRYAISTVILTKDYILPALVLCQSFRDNAGPSFPADIDIVAYVPKDFKERKIDEAMVRLCFDDVRTIDMIKPIRQSERGSWSEQYSKFSIFKDTKYKRIIYMDSDTINLNFGPMNDIIRSNLKFAMVQDWIFNHFSPDWWNGGLYLFEPSQKLYDYFMNSMANVTAQGYRYYFVDQAYTGALLKFPGGGHTLPAVYNLNLAMLVENGTLWDYFFNGRGLFEIVNVHHTILKPHDVIPGADIHDAVTGIPSVKEWKMYYDSLVKTHNLGETFGSTIYAYDKSKNQLCRKWNEHTATILRCPDPTKKFSQIEFASFGTPSGNCRDISLINSSPKCHASTSKERIGVACFGKSECSFNAHQSSFGDVDPCPGSGKYMIVLLRCE